MHTPSEIEVIQGRFHWIDWTELKETDLVYLVPNKAMGNTDCWQVNICQSPPIGMTGSLRVVDALSKIQIFHFSSEEKRTLTYGKFPGGPHYAIIEQAQCPAPPVSPSNAIG